MGISGSQPALMYALGAVMRGGASRGGYHSGDVFITIGGVKVGAVRDYPDVKVIIDSLQIADALDETPNTCQMTLMSPTWTWGTGGVPPNGLDIIITMGSQNAGTREFAGTLLSTEAGHEGRPISSQASVALHAIDYTYLANQRKVSGFYQTQSATAIAIDLMQRATSGFTVVHVQTGLPIVDEITFTNQDVSSALTALAKRVGAYWYLDYFKDLHFFLDEPDVQDPLPLTPEHPSLAPEIGVSTDGSQVVTRAYCEGGGVNALTDVKVGDSSVPVEDVAWYDPAGGTVAVGTQRLKYTGVRLGGTGTVIGTGAQPTSLLTLALALGNELGVGVYQYAFTFITASGETKPSPLATITTTPNTSNPSLIGVPVGDSGSPYDTGGLTGIYSWRYTFQRAADGLETAPSPASPLLSCNHYRVNLPLASCQDPPVGFARRWYRGTGIAPARAMTSYSTVPNTNLPPGKYGWMVTFITAGGETSGTPTAPPATAPGLALNATYVQSASGYYKIGDSLTTCVVYLTAAGVTTPSPVSTAVVIRDIKDFGWPGDPGLPCCGVAYPLPVSADPAVTNKRIYQALNGVWMGYVTVPNSTTGVVVGGWNVTGSPPGVNTAGGLGGLWITVASTCGMHFFDVPTGPSGVTARKIYRTPINGGAGGSEYRLAGTLADNSTVEFIDTVPDAGLGVLGPSINTAVVPSSFRLLPASQLTIGWAEAAGNFVDTTPDAALTTAPPATSQFTGNGQRVHVSDISKGPTGTTVRKLYRTAVGGAQLKYVVTIPDNTSTAIDDTFPDAGLGVNVPAVDASGLAQPSGQILPGDPSIVVAATAAFSSAGGWAVVGNGQQVIRYSFISGLTLMGIPYSGPGAITSAISFNSSITEAPALTGIPQPGFVGWPVPVGGIAIPIRQGDPVNLLVQLEDTIAQATLAAKIGGDGVIEDYIQDNRLGKAEALSRARAKLVQQSLPLVTLTYRCRDRNTRSGRTITVNLPLPPIVYGAYKIQSVTIANFGPHVMPTYTVSASSARFSFESLLRVLGGKV